MSGSNCFFLTCIEVSQEISKVVWYSHHLKNFQRCWDPHSQRLWCSYLSRSRCFSGIILLFLWLNSSVQLLSCVRLFAAPWTAAHQAFLSITNSQSLLRLMFIESVMTFNHLILCCRLLLLPSIFPSISVFSNESVLHIRWPKYWKFSFSIIWSNECWNFDLWFFCLF